MLQSGVMVLNFDDIWAKFLELIKKELNPVSFSTWFGKTKLYEMDDKKIVLLVPMLLHKRFLLSNYYNLISDSFTTITGVEREIDCVLEEEVNKTETEVMEEAVNNVEVIDNENIVNS